MEEEVDEEMHHWSLDDEGGHGDAEKRRRMRWKRR